MEWLLHSSIQAIYVICAKSGMNSGLVHRGKLQLYLKIGGTLQSSQDMVALLSRAYFQREL